MSSQINHQNEIRSAARFAFGDNWSKFLRVLNEQRIDDAVKSLKIMLEVDNLEGKTFLDIGSGSGLFSLAARKMGAKVYSFDYDSKSVACTEELKKIYFENDTEWEISSGSVLDVDYMCQFGTFDVVYSWGVLHHTGNMWAAQRIIDGHVSQNGKLFIALYNFQPIASRYWTWVKKTYNKYSIARPLLISMHFLYPVLPSLFLRGLKRGKYPRGMYFWYDLIDWLGGYPFEVSTPEQVFDFWKSKGYVLEKLKTVGGKLGCNEFVFRRIR